MAFADKTKYMSWPQMAQLQFKAELDSVETRCATYGIPWGGAALPTIRREPRYGSRAAAQRVRLWRHVRPFLRV